MQQQRQRPWDNLPSSALVNIFSKSSLKDRLCNLPFVCKSWANSSRHPHCWASFIPDSYYSFPPPPLSSSVVAVDAFVKSSFPYDAAFLDPFDGRRNSDPQCGVLVLQSLIAKAGGGAAVTSVYFLPFLTSLDGPPNDDALLSLIARSCPNLKHLSFHGSFNASEEVLLEVVRSCPCLELVDFSDSPYMIPLILEKMGIHCPSIRGIRQNGNLQPFCSFSLVKCFPSLKLLNLSDSSIGDKDLLTLVTGDSRLEYLDIMRCQRLIRYMYLIKGAHNRIAEIRYD
ncbi:F-box protein SKIP1 [Nicotiana tabacum]|uniref:F-box protein SKIP1 n=1 Tax=Nicotiana tabacum TaxID=4097 RepID=A0A1S3ZAY4_TOBAC|nr:F-box protein SKIP1-like [Nicotiana tomentosiformis]XP_016461509.1 PREDICTED: F-box protein SKIP1-like [Nicotiana tabacum]